MPHTSEPTDTAPASWRPDADGLDVRLLDEAWSTPSAAELPSGARPGYLPGAARPAPSRPRRRRRRYRGPRHSTRTTPNHFGHCPAQPRRFKPWLSPDFLRPAIEAQQRAYFARGTNADPHPALLLRAQQGAIREAQRLGLPVPLKPRKRVRSDLRESQDIFASFLFKHVDLDSHLVGKPDGKGHIIPYALTEMLDEIHKELAHHPNAYLGPADPTDPTDPKRAFSFSTLNRRIRDYKEANYIKRWQRSECEVDDEGEEQWDGFVANMRVTNAFFHSLGYSEEDLREEARRRREERGYKTDVSPPVHTARYEAVLRRNRRHTRSRQHEKERRGHAGTPRQLVSTTIDVCLHDLTAEDGAAGDGLAILDAAAELRRQLDTKELSPQLFRRAVMHRVRRRKSPRSPP